MSEDAIKIFYSYSRRDLELLKTLEGHLSLLRHAGKIITWYDLELEAGKEWELGILHKIDAADIILLLISPDFFHSEYCRKEMRRAMERHDKGEARVIPVILRSCDWKIPEVEISKLNAVPSDTKAITQWEDQDQAFTIVAQKIRETVQQISKKKFAEKQPNDQKKQRTEQKRQKTAKSPKVSSPRSQQAVNYTRLVEFLAQERWQDADQETWNLILKISGRENEDSLRVEDIKRLSCAGLRTINGYWLNYSNNRFGFSVQERIWEECGSPMELNSDWERFGVRVGWMKRKLFSVEEISYGEVIYDIRAPIGHLPVWPAWKCRQNRRSVHLFARFKACKF